MGSQRLIISTAVWGWDHPTTAFDDTPSASNISSAAITKIEIWYGECIYALQLHRTDTSPLKRGGSGGQKAEFTLESDEFITLIDGTGKATGASSSSGGYTTVTSLRFVTNKGNIAEFGSKVTSYTFSWPSGAGVSEDKAPHMGLLSFKGCGGTCIYQLKPTFAEYRWTRLAPKKMKYEIMTELSTIAQTAIPDAARTPAPLSKFALHLKAPVVTLYVGPEQTEFHAYEDVLCQLPFFRAALQGKFKEASEKSIIMPEDDPGILSALVEYLSIGTYSYPYDPKKTRSGGSTPVGDLVEGVFHIGVYAIGSKYDCADLVADATHNFREVLKELDGIQTPRLWAAAYSEGLRLTNNWGTNTDLVQWKAKLTREVGLLFTDHTDEMDKMMFEYPELSRDLLHAITTPVTETL